MTRGIPSLCINHEPPILWMSMNMLDANLSIDKSDIRQSNKSSSNNQAMTKQQAAQITNK